MFEDSCYIIMILWELVFVIGCFNKIKFFSIIVVNMFLIGKIDIKLCVLGNVYLK